MKQILIGVIAIFAWFALIGQFYLIIVNNDLPLTEILIRYFTFFTIDTNILVALCSSALLLKGSSGKNNLFTKQTTLAAVTVYIVVVGITYNIILRFIWSPQGFQRVVDELLHLIIPVLFLLYWLAFVPKNELKWKYAFPWMIFPAIYGAVVLIRGYYSSLRYYPYPFIDVSKLGVNQGTINSIAFVLIFFVGSLLFIGIGKLISRSKS